MHECTNCGMLCDCDMEDIWNEQPEDCSCDCAGFEVGGEGDDEEEVADADQA